MLALEHTIIYGPLFSRRLNLSLGINLLPTARKLCSFDCVYCHYGPATPVALTPHPALFPAVAEVLAAVERGLRAHPNLPYLTFSGNGEPTLHPGFPEIVAGVMALRDALSPQTRLAAFSNATAAGQPRIREALARLDAPILKLDAGDAHTLTQINRPTPAVTLEALIAGIRATPGAIVQSVLLGGALSQAGGPAYAAWLAALDAAHPTAVQVYSTDYPVATAGIETLPLYVLRRIAAEVQQRLGIPAQAYGL